MSFDKNKVNLIVMPKSTLKVYKTPSTASEVLQTLKKGSPAGRTSGTYLKMKDSNYWQINLYSPVKGANHGYVKENEFTTNEPSVNKEAEKNSDSLLQNLVKNDKNVFDSLMTNAILIKKAQAKGIDTAKYENKLNNLISVYNARQKKIETSKLVKFKRGLENAGKKLVNIFKKIVGAKTSGIGIEPITITCIFIAGAATAALVYYAFKPEYDNSKENLKSSQELEKALSNLTPTEAQALKQNLETQIDDAYNQGKTDQSFSSVFGNIKTFLFVGAGAFLAYKFMQIRNNKK